VPDDVRSAGDTDVVAMLSSLEVDQRPGRYVYVSVPHGRLLRVDVQPLAMVEEAEGTTYVVHQEDADRDGYHYDFVGAWLTVRVHSSLAAVGLTAVISRALADAGVAANMLAGTYHDHVIVPCDRVDDARAAIAALRHDGQ
jgi:uncharacterized protein